MRRLAITAGHNILRMLFATVTQHLDVFSMILPIQFFTPTIHQSKPKALRPNPTYEIAIRLGTLFKSGYQRLYVFHGGIKIFTGDRRIENEDPQFRSGYE